MQRKGAAGQSDRIQGGPKPGGTNAPVKHVLADGGVRPCGGVEARVRHCDRVVRRVVIRDPEPLRYRRAWWLELQPGLQSDAAIDAARAAGILHCYCQIIGRVIDPSRIEGDIERLSPADMLADQQAVQINRGVIVDVEEVKREGPCGGAVGKNYGTKP